MKTHERIIKHLEAGERVLVKSDDGYFAFHPLNLEYRWQAGWCRQNKDEAIDARIEGSLTEEEIEHFSKRDSWQIVDTWVEPIPTLKKGQKVRVRDDVKEICERMDFTWINSDYDFVGEQCVVISGNSSYRVELPNGSITVFPREALTVIAEEEDEIVEMTLEEVAKLKGVSVDKLRIKE